jgi:hypothetical protein
MAKYKRLPVIANRINTRLKSAILASGQFQRDVARAANIDETRLSDIVRGRTLATAIEQHALAVVLNAPVSQLFDPVEPRRPPTTSTAA